MLQPGVNYAAAGLRGAQPRGDERKYLGPHYLAVCEFVEIYALAPESEQAGGGAVLVHLGQQARQRRLKNLFQAAAGVRGGGEFPRRSGPGTVFGRFTGGRAGGVQRGRGQSQQSGAEQQPDHAVLPKSDGLTV